MNKTSLILINYKKNLANWISRADKNMPPVNQKGRIVQEIDAEALTAMERLIIQERVRTLRCIASFDSDSMLELKEWAGDEIRTLETKLPINNKTEGEHEDE